jgi:hypothetical protein
MEKKLVRYVKLTLEEEGIEVRQISFVADAKYPDLPWRYGLYVKTSKGYCRYVWEEPEGWVDLMESIDSMLLRIISESVS